MAHQSNKKSGPEGLAFGLGCFSVGLGLAELAAPASVTRLIGIRPTSEAMAVLRAIGARELANGVAILAEPDRAAWLWGRVSGDAVDLLSLAQADKTDPGRTAAAAAAVVGVTVLDVVAALRVGSSAGSRAPQRVQVTEAVTINRSIEEVYAFWRRFENFPRFMRHIEAVETSGRRSHWRAVGPAGVRVDWDAELVDDVENERLSWRTLEGATVEHRGSVRFTPAPGARGTEIRVDLHYNPPAGQLGRGITWLLGSDPEGLIREDLRRFKQILEAGEVVISDGPALKRPAQPIGRAERLKSLVRVQS